MSLRDSEGEPVTLIDPALSPLAAMSSDDLAAFLEEECAGMGPSEDCDDPLLLVFWEEVRRWMLSRCAHLADHLHRTTGRPIVAIEHFGGRDPDDRALRHAMVADIAIDEVRRMLAQGRGADNPIIDALEKATLGRRDEFYGDNETRYTIPEDDDPSWLGEMRSCGGKLVPYHPAERLPGIAVAFGREFDVRRAALEIVCDPEHEDEFDRYDLTDAADAVLRWADNAPYPPRI